ncbi:hypothetical protein K435DRAFT_842013 [Dendrothele bispora CBS 962.96]|uniref:Uncharacterized protein n=1 Tax=Dendrothele bispora (strain CBS 962.96) TaxID=1314807 RepID=A0A4S8LIJ9_DENBC|nr:hypothetical protein K435DRAFT_842013 [Dendrothele bispora CBS 962.96]
MSQAPSPPSMSDAPVAGAEIFDPYFYGSFITSVWPLRSLVGALVALDFVMTCYAQILHHYRVANFGNLGVIAIIPTPLDVEALLLLVIVFIVEGFFAYRVWKIGNSHWIVPVLIALCAGGGAAAGIATTIGQFQNNLVIVFEGSKQKLEVGLNASHGPLPLQKLELSGNNSNVPTIEI